ncbi:helix-turn-helix transcriptional regulator, partial [Nocardia brevicatena]|uniref:helix-turn-helix transcriptional regulator n=1 Tax=Nocardia brevicatena TaxID=37327 RepID=UPI0012FB5376
MLCPLSSSPTDGRHPAPRHSGQPGAECWDKGDRGHGSLCPAAGQVDSMRLRCHRGATMSEYQPDEDRYVGRQVRAIRARRGISQQVLADRVGVSRGAIAKYEAGERPVDS